MIILVKKRAVLLYSLLIFLMLVIGIACTSKKTRNIKAYYLPLEELTDGLVYEYNAINNDQLPPFYWYFRITKIKDQIILSSQYFDYQFRIQQLSKEVVVTNGVILNEFSLFRTDTLTGKQTQNPVRVELDNAFPFEVTDSTGVFLYKLYWQDSENPNQKIRLIRNRHFMGDATYRYQNKSVDCVRFLVKELLEVDEEGFQEFNYQGTELYAKGIGLVYFKKVIGENVAQEYELVDRYDMATLEQKFKESLGEE